MVQPEFNIIGEREIISDKINSDERDYFSMDCWKLKVLWQNLLWGVRRRLVWLLLKTHLTELIDDCVVGCSSFRFCGFETGLVGVCDMSDHGLCGDMDSSDP